MATIVDNVLDELSISQLLRQFEGSALEPGARTVLPFIDVPCKLDRRIRQILHRQLSSADHTDDTDSAAPGQLEPSPRDNDRTVFGTTTTETTVRMPGRLARGSSAMHVDTGFDQNDSPVDLNLSGLVCVLYLDGDGHLVIDDGSGVEQSIPVTRGRLVLWPNDTCIHRLDAGNNTRAMIGPMNLSSDGVWNRAGDQYAAMYREREGRSGDWNDTVPKAEQAREKAAKKAATPAALPSGYVKKTATPAEEMEACASYSFGDECYSTIYHSQHGKKIVPGSKGKVVGSSWSGKGSQRWLSTKVVEFENGVRIEALAKSQLNTPTEEAARKVTADPP